jgi:hypothetical protein
MQIQHIFRRSAVTSASQPSHGASMINQYGHSRPASGGGGCLEDETASI